MGELRRKKIRKKRIKHRIQNSAKKVNHG